MLHSTIMRKPDSVLSPVEARAYYDRFGKKQDSQGFYEDPPLFDMVAHADFEQAREVFEFGCGTGKLAAHLLADRLPAAAHYLGYDVSPTMVALTKQRLAPYADRAAVHLSDGKLHFPLADQRADRVVSCYVLDLLSEDDTRAFFTEAHRVLMPGGMLCLVSLTQGVSRVSRLVAALWMRVFRLRAALVGGCRPVRLDTYVQSTLWQHAYGRVLTAFGVPSEVLVLRRR